MALTLTKVGRNNVAGNLDFLIYDVTFDSSYPAGGESLTAADVGLTKIFYVSDGVSDTGYVTRYNYSTSKLQAFDSDYSTSTDGPLQETGTTNLATSDVRVLIVGY